MCRCMKHPPNHQDNNDEYNQTLYLSVISRLCYCAVVGVADGGCAGCLYYHAEFSGGNAVLRRISLLQLQLWLSAEYALFFCVMCCVGWQFTRRTQSELKSRLHCWLVFAPVYLWLILWNIIFYIAPAKIALLESIRNFFLLVVWLPLNFSPFWPQPWTDFIGPISAQLGFALGYYCQWCSKNRCQIRKLSEWGTCLSFVTLGMMAWALR